MEWSSVLQRIESGEDGTTEFKRVWDRSSVGKAICAFANNQGGVVLLGVDKGGSIAGVREDPESLQERMTSFLQTGCSAPVPARCGRHEDPHGWVHWIAVPRVRGPEPLRYGGRFYVRRERSSVEPSPSELQELFDVFGFIMTEEQLIRPATVSDIDPESFHSYLRAQDIETEAEPQPPMEKDFQNAGVVGEDDGSFRPTLYGLMAFGRNPQRYPHTRDFQVQCSAYAGQDRASGVISVGSANGRLDEQVRRALGWMESLGWSESYTGLAREDRGLLPGPAIREALVNAVVHRDYAITGSPVQFEVFRDHASVTSPGTLPNHMSVESVRAGSLPRSRNEAMAHAMVVAKLMERRGRGWPTMRRAMLKFNGTEPDLIADSESRFVRVTFHRTA